MAAAQPAGSPPGAFIFQIATSSQHGGAHRRSCPAPPTWWPCACWLRWSGAVIMPKLPVLLPAAGAKPLCCRLFCAQVLMQPFVLSQHRAGSQTLCIEGREVALDTISISEHDADMADSDDEFRPADVPAPCRPLLGAGAITLEVSADIINYYMDYEPVYSPGDLLTSAFFHTPRETPCKPESTRVKAVRQSCTPAVASLHGDPDAIVTFCLQLCVGPQTAR